MKSLLCVIKTSLIVCRTTTRLQPRRNPAVASGAKVKQLSFSYRKAGNVLEVFDDPSDVDHSELAKIAIRDCANAPRRPRSAEAEYKKFLKIALSTDQSVQPKYFHDLEGKFFRARRCWLNCDANHVNLHSPATSDVTRAVNLPKTAFSRWTGGAIGETRNKVRGVHSPFLYVSADKYGASFSNHVEDHYLYSFSFLHRGASKFWVIIAPWAAGRFEAYLEKYMRVRWQSRWQESMGCSQFARHCPLWVNLGALRAWGIPFHVVEQRQGDLIVTAPGAYHQGWNGGANIAEAVNWGDGMTRQRTAQYRECRPGCYTGNVGKDADKIVILQWPQTTALAVYTSMLPTSPVARLFDVMDNQPTEQPWRVHDLPGQRPSPLILEDLFEEDGEENIDLVCSTGAQNNFVCYIQIANH